MLAAILNYKMVIVISADDESEEDSLSTARRNDGSREGAKRIKVEVVDEEDVKPPTETPHQDEHILYRGKWYAFKKSKTFYRNSTDVAKKILFPSSTVNSSVPSACDEELGFIIDSSKLQFAADVTCDETGKYHRPSYSRCALVLGKENNVKLLKQGGLSGGDEYTLLRRYYAHRDTPGFFRTVYELQRDGYRACPNVLIRYEWRTEKTALRLTPHGNSKRDETPYIRSKKQLLTSLKQSSKGKSAQVKMNEIFDHEGGSTGIGSFSSVARNRNQVYRHSPSEKKGTDFNRLMEMNVSGGFVRSVEFTNDDGKGPNPRCCLYTDKQIADIKKHCIDGSVLTFDATFDLGKMYVTIASYRHQGFVNKTNEKNVLMPGPILLHCKKDIETYRYFGNQISKALDNKKISAFGTDGEKAMYKGLQETNSFKQSDHLLCMLHHRQNVDSKLQKLGVKNNADKILRSIYGEQVKETRHEGLVDSSTEKEYEEGLQFWCTRWDSLEEEETGKDPMFSTWFRQYKSQEVRESMLKPLRQKAGLGDPPRQFTTNDSESINAMLSKWVGGQKSWDDLADSLEAFVRSKYKELEMALMGLGERKVSPGLKELQKTQLEWTHMTMAERRAVLECADLDVEEENEAALSIEPEESGIGGFTIHELRTVWRKAGKIMATDHSVVDFPATSDQMICFDGDQHFRITQKDLFICDKNCRSFAFHNRLFCEHTLAVADQKGKLAEFLCKINGKRRSSSIDLVNSVLNKQCSGSGKKSTQKRKGANNAVSTVISTVIPQQRPAQPFTVTRKVGVIKKCYGCKQEFSNTLNFPPHDLILKKMDIREWFDKTSGEKKQTFGLVPTYYHLKLNCVRIRYPYTELKDILVYQEIQQQLTAEHIAILRDFGIDIA
ncbi:uncharacterized protein LOC105442659 [Strongylocentrotus purpuratus]|uniref:SWIM-type domain-containing protein n=1 Tax=Strongylocentrotus purpuratus TaxID=7668 RepID=A0A7M7PJE6_STRPU|nr:uncharacterized protein LOC105442659 [Strongylocentrotus purpuratus]